MSLSGTWCTGYHVANLQSWRPNYMNISVQGLYSVSQMLLSTMMITVLVLQCHNIISIKPTVNLYTCNNCASIVNVTLIKAVWSIISQFIVLHWSPTPGKVNALIMRLYCVNFHSQMSMQVHDNVHYNDLATSQQPCMICREIELSIACTVVCTLNKKLDLDPISYIDTIAI